MNNERRWPLALIIIGIVLVASIVILSVNWGTDNQVPLWGYLLGLPIGIIIGYGWNLLVFTLASRFLNRVSASWKALGKPNDERKWFFLFYLALLHIPIGEAYAQTIWENSQYSLTLIPAMSQIWQIIAILMPMVMTWLVSFVLAYAELKWEKRQAALIAVFLSIFTLSWIQPLLPYIMGRVA
jgi:hypothetical protein